MQVTVNQLSEIELLETRMLFAASPLSISQASFLGGTQLRVTGTSKADAIVITAVEGGLLVANADWSKVVTGTFKSVWVDAADGNDVIALDPTLFVDAILQGGKGNDSVTGGSGNDRILGGAGTNKLFGGNGNDTMISLGIGGASVDSVTGGEGFDSFWADSSSKEKILDASSAETGGGAVHRVSSFFSSNNGKVTNKAVTSSSRAEKLADPKTTNKAIVYKNFANLPLFAESGPSADDVEQGYLGDCYYLASLSSMAKVNPNSIQQSIVDLGDGTYCVQFTRGSTKVFVRVDADLPTWNGGPLAYANVGAQNSTWAALMEKAYAYFRTNKGTYASLEGGWMQDVYRDLGLKNRSFFSASSATNLLSLIKGELDSGRYVTFGVGKVPSGAPLIGSHAYTVHEVICDEEGKPVALVLRNPWAIDGAGEDGANDGYVTITASQAAKAFIGFSSANS